LEVIPKTHDSTMEKDGTTDRQTGAMKLISNENKPKKKE
jgi:hypothetical protein